MATLSKIDSFKASNASVWAWLEESKNSFSFAASLHAAVHKYGSLTPKQLAAAQNCVAKSTQKKLDKLQEIAVPASIDVEALFGVQADDMVLKGAPVVKRPVVNGEPLADALKAAKKAGLRYPKMKFAAFQASLAGDEGRNPGAIYLKDGEIYLGKVTPSGEFHKSRDCSVEKLAEIEAAFIDPLKEAVNYGRLTGNCSCCSRPLTNKESVELGIGPICRDKFGF